MLGLWRQVLRLLHYSSGRLSLIVGAITIAEVVFSILGLWLIKVLIDTLSSRANVSDATGEVFLILGLAGLSTLAAFVLQAYGTFLRTRQGMLVADYIDREIHDRAIQVDLGFYESPAYFDSLQRARQAGAQRPAQMVSGLLMLGKGFAFLLAISGMLLGIEWRLLPLLLIAVLAALAVRMFFTRQSYDWQRRRVQLERRAAYFDWLLTSDQHAKELRLHDLGTHFLERYSDLRRKIRDEVLRIERSRAVAEIGVAIAGVAVFVGSIAFLLFQAIASAFTLGDLVLFVLLFRRAEQSGREVVASLSRLYEDQLYLGQLFSFLEVEQTIRPPAAPREIPETLARGLQFENVSFRYPDTEENALEGVDFTMPAGKLVALVGENGSSKTTLIKLLTRLYDPDSGRVCLDGIDVREFDPIAYRRLFSVIFQDFAKYAATVSENIWYGDAERPLDPAQIADAAERAGAAPFLTDLPMGYDTPLSRVFDEGRELSIGQWQRVALSRAFLPSSRFIVMDEPTSSVDPVAEMELFDTLRDRISNRGALIISHRVSTIRHVDYTYVLEKGRIVEHGTHDDLVEQGGQYSELFGRQASYFR
ncbi:MAG: ABC transporter ATP-binding protein [Pseudomonadota bacterium]